MGTPTLMKVKDVKKSYLIDGNLMIEAIVRINEMEGIEKKNLRCFDESMKHCSDVALVLNGQKFFVSKLTLAYQSSYFEGMFLRTFEESKKSEVELDGIDPKDFQNFLELLYGEPSVNDETVDGILKLIDMFDAKLALQKCENFLIQESKKELKEKFQMAYQFKMEKLRDSCLSEVKTVQILRSVLTCDLEEMDPFVVRELLKISLQKHSFDY
uniref:BTB domain-containing protein n=1 Tax=Caenorhabditis tropicalis TaxID=1561998 RepID=A0A1I7TGP6_9PELO